jgi:hypothetical protein
MWIFLSIALLITLAFSVYSNLKENDKPTLRPIDS